MGYINVNRKTEEGPYSLAWDLDYWHFPYSILDKYSGNLVTFRQDETSFDIPQGLIKTLDTPIELANINTSVVIEIPVYYNATLTTNYHDLISVDPLFAIQDNSYSGYRRLVTKVGSQGVIDAAYGQIPNGWSIQRFTVTQSGMLWEQSIDDGVTFTTVYNWVEDLSAEKIAEIKTLACAGGRYTRPAIEPFKDWTIKVDGGENLLKLTEPYYTTTRHYTGSNSYCVTGGDVFVTDSNYYGYCSTSSHIPFETADSWEFRTKLNYSGGSGTYRYVLYHSGSSWDMGPYIQIINGESGLTDNTIDLVIPVDGVPDGYIAIMNENYPLSTHTNYYLKAGFTGTEYYFLLGENGWDGTFTTLGTYTTTLKCTNNVSNVLSLFGDINGNSSHYVYGSMYMKDTCVYINGQKYWEAVTKDNGNSQNQADSASLEDNNLSPGGWL